MYNQDQESHSKTVFLIFFGLYKKNKALGFILGGAVVVACPR